MVGTRPGFVSSFTKAVVPAPRLPPIKHINRPDNNNTSRVSNFLIIAIKVATTITIPAITILYFLLYVKTVETKLIISTVFTQNISQNHATHYTSFVSSKLSFLSTLSRTSTPVTISSISANSAGL